MKKMKKIIQLNLLSIFCLLTTQAQTVYVDWIIRSKLTPLFRGLNPYFSVCFSCHSGGC